MEIPNRTFNVGDYRFGFNGKEADRDGGWGSLNHYDYGFRIYNPGIGRFLSVDPLRREYAELTPYQFASNTPIQAIDLDGLEARLSIYNVDIGRPILDINVDNPFSLGIGHLYLEVYNLKVNRFQKATVNEGPKGPLGIRLWNQFKTYRLIEGTYNISLFYQENYLGELSKVSFFEQIPEDNGSSSQGHLEAAAEVLTGELVFGAISRIGRGLFKGLRPIAGKWITTTESMSEAAEKYQKFITGRPANQSFLRNGVKFDGVKNGILIDAKSGYANFINPKTGAFHNWFKGGDSLLDQARRQLQAADGVSIQWHFQNNNVRTAVQNLFNDHGIQGIELIFSPLK